MDSLIHKFVHESFYSDFIAFFRIETEFFIHTYSHLFTGFPQGKPQVLLWSCTMDFFSLWDQFLEYIDKNDHQFHHMFSFDVFPLSLDNYVLTISPKRPYLVRWIEAVYKKKMETILTQLAGHPIQVAIMPPESSETSSNFPPVTEVSMPQAADPVHEEYPMADPFPETHVAREKEMPLSKDLPMVDDPFPEETAPPDFSNLTAKSADEVALPSIEDFNDPLHSPSLFADFQKETPTKSFRPNPISEENTFDTFVHGNCNEMAYQAAFAVAKTAVHPELTDRKMNPLFIYGPSGLGKTHLLHAICNYIRANKPHLSVLLVSSETFTNELIDAIQSHTMAKFRQKYRNLDFLLIDDVQFFGSRESTKLEIFNTFNELFDKQSNIIMTSDRTPADIEKLEARLQSRFSSGLVAPISPPDYEICCVILNKRAQKMNINLPKDVVDYIAGHINTNIRELEGAFNKLVTFSHFKNAPITLDFTKEALKDLIPIDNEREITIDYIIDEVCKFYGVKKEILLANGRQKKIVIPRQIAMYLCRTELNESYPTLRDAFRRKDHSTVLYACERVQKDLVTDPQTKSAVESIRRLLRGK